MRGAVASGAVAGIAGSNRQRARREQPAPSRSSAADDARQPRRVSRRDLAQPSAAAALAAQEAATARATFTAAEVLAAAKAFASDNRDPARMRQIIERTILQPREGGDARASTGLLPADYKALKKRVTRKAGKIPAARDTANEKAVPQPAHAPAAEPAAAEPAATEPAVVPAAVTPYITIGASTDPHHEYFWLTEHCEQHPCIGDISRSKTGFTRDNAIAQLEAESAEWSTSGRSVKIGKDALRAAIKRRSKAKTPAGADGPPRWPQAWPDGSWPARCLAAKPKKWRWPRAAAAPEEDDLWEMCENNRGRGEEHRFWLVKKEDNAKARDRVATHAARLAADDAPTL